MKPLAFETYNNNHYLFSPKVRKFILIPAQSYRAFKNNEIETDEILSILKDKGYLLEYSTNFNRVLTAAEIEYAFVNIPQIVFEVTSHCNLRCKYCCFGENYQTFANRASGTLNFESAKILLDHISRLSFSKQNTCSNTPLILSFYGGEPLLNISLIRKIVDYAKSLTFKNRYLRFSLTTNATLIAENIEYLKENNFSILVSLDGDISNNAYRVFQNGAPSFQTVLSNLNFIKERHPEYFKTIRYNSVYTNLSDVTKILNFFHAQFGKTPQLSPLHFSDGECITDELKKMICKIPDASQSLIEGFPSAFLEFPIHKLIVQLLMYMTDSLYYNELSFIQSHEDFSHFLTHTCVPFTKRLFLSVDNKIMPCEKVSRHKPIGYIKDGIVDINYSYVAKHFNSSTSSYKPLCSKCAMELMCNHCSYTSSMVKGCPEYKDISQLETILGHIFSYIEDNPGILNLIMGNVILK